MTAACRHCAHPLTRVLIDLGQQPLANAYRKADATDQEPRYPLRVMICDHCYLVQVEESVPADAIFRADYAYFSSYSSSWVDHARRYADAMIERFGLGESSQVVEVASNDGYLLQHFVTQGIPCFGIEPARGCAEAARARGVETIVDFFDHGLAEKLRATGKAADLMVANNVLAHVPRIDDFVEGFAALLGAEGVASFEFPHLLELIKKTQFDTIYHEHYSYLSLAFAKRLFTRHGLRIFDAQRLSTHGGSLRIFVCHQNAAHPETPAISEILAQETGARLDRPEGFADFARNARAMSDALRMFLDEARKSGKQVAAYGAAAKGNTFLNFCGVSAADICYAVDRNPEKQGKLLPGSQIPVRAPDALRETRPDLVLILPWNLAEEIGREHAYIGQWGGRFVVAAPQIRLL